MLNYLRRHLLFYLLVCGSLFLFPSIGFARTFYVDFSASSNGDGSESSPYNSQAAFASAFAAGDTVYFAGTFTGSSFGITDKDATTTTPSVFSQWTGRTTATFAGTGSSGFSMVNSDNVQMNGMSFSSTGAAGIFVNGGSGISITSSTAASTAGAGIQVNDATNVTITGVTAQNAFTGIATSGTVTGLTVTGSTLTGNSNGSSGHGITLLGGSNYTITNNTITSNTGSGIHIGGGTTVSTVTVTGNTVHSNSINGINLGSTLMTGITVSGNKVYNHTSTSSNQGIGIGISSNGPTVQNNLIYRNVMGLFFSGAESTTLGTLVQNNTISNNSSVGIVFRETSPAVLSNFTIENNSITTATDGKVYAYPSGDGPSWTSLTYNHYYLVGSNARVLSESVSTLAQWQTLTSGDANAITADPLFTNTTSGSEDFTLQAASPLIDAGKVGATTPTTDYAANSRPWTGGTGGAGRYEIGAYEKQNLVSSTNVALAGVASYNAADAAVGNQITLTITDATNTGAYYGITTDAGAATWLDGNGGTTTTPTYSTSKTWTHQGLAANTAFSYQLRIAYGSTATSYLPLLTAVSATTAPAQVTGVTATSQSGGKALVAWEAVTGAATYDVSYGRNSDADDIVVDGITKTQRLLQKLVKGKHYFVKVRAVGAGGAQGAWSDVVHFETRFPTLGITISRADGLGNQVFVYNIAGKRTLKFKAFPKASTAMMVVKTLDVDNDGDVEIVVGRYDEGSGSTIRLFDHKGKFIVETAVFSKSIKNGISMAAGDFNFDGKDELAVIPYKGKAELRLYYYHIGQKKFKQMSFKQVFPATERGGARVFAADLNGDYKDDVIVTQQGRKNLTSYTVDEDNKLTEIAELTIPIKGSQLATGDVDGDGNDEILVVADLEENDSKIRVYDLNANNKFDLLITKRPYASSVTGAFRIRTGDLNGDGKEEVVIVPGAGNPGDLRVLSYDPTEKKVQKKFVELDGERVGTDDELQGKHLGIMDLDQSGKSEIIVASISQDPSISIYSLTDKEKLKLIKKFTPEEGDDNGWDIGGE